MAEEKYPLASDELALHYHLLEAMTGTPAEPAIEKFFISDALSRIQRQLKVSPFSRPRVRQALRYMAGEGLVARHRQGRRIYYCITDSGRRAYNNYKEVMVLWQLEKRFGKKAILKTITQISLKKKGEDKLHMPSICFLHMPLAYRPVEHRFEKDREIRIFEATLRRQKQ